MYNNRIRRTATNLDLQSLIRRADIAYDERARYVEFVCAVWNEGRFGPDLADPVIIDLSDRPELEPAEFYDLCNDGPIGLGPTTGCRLSPLGRAAYQKIKSAFRRAKQMMLVDAGLAVRNSLAALTPNQGRGSP